jgi:CheY-like chemotaxis protein
MAKILIIDDEEDIRIILRHSLEAAGHVVVEATDGQAGVRVWRAERPELVVTDIVMAGTDGLELITELRRQDPGVKVIAMSGDGLRGKQTLLDESVRLGALRVINKPFDLHELLQAVKELLGQRV